MLFDGETEDGQGERRDGDRTFGAERDVLRFGGTHVHVVGLAGEDGHRRLHRGGADAAELQRGLHLEREQVRDLDRGGVRLRVDHAGGREPLQQGGVRYGRDTYI